MNNNEYCYYALLIPCFDNIAACKKKGFKWSYTKSIRYFVETNYIGTIEKIKSFFGNSFVSGNMMNKWEPEADFLVMIHPC